MSARARTGGVLALAALVLGLAACGGGGGDDQTTGSVSADDARKAREGWPAAAGAHLDSANQAFSAQDHREALRHYEAILGLADLPQNARVAAWFGIRMAQTALGDSVAAAAAEEKLQELAPGASLLHDNPMMGTPARTMPDDSIHRGM